MRSETDAEARQLIERAIALDPQLGWAYGMRARIERIYDFNWAAAEVSLKRARELEPGSVNVLREAGLFASSLGRFDESLALMRQGVELDPAAPDAYVFLAVPLMAVGKWESAERNYRKALELEPQFPNAHYGIALTHLFRKEFDRALAEAELEPIAYLRLSAMTAIYHALRRKTESDAALRELTEKYASDAAYRIAESHAYRDEVDQAMRWLEQAYKDRDAGVARILSNPLLRPLAHDPRYQAFLRKLNLPTECR